MEAERAGLGGQVTVTAAQGLSKVVVSVSVELCGVHRHMACTSVR